MINLLSQKIVSWQLQKGFIEEKEKEVYEYGFEIFIGQILNILISILIALFFQYYLLFVFIVAYIPLRIFAGGDHARNSERCTATSSLMLMVICVLGKYLPADSMKLTLFILELPSLLAIIVLAPVECRNKPLDMKERKKYRELTYIIVFFEVICALILYKFKLAEMANTIIITHIVMAIILVIGWKKLVYR